MKRNEFKHWFCGVMLFAAALFAACGDDDKGTDNGGNGGNGGQQPAATLAVSPESIELDAQAGSSATFTITTTAAWTATPSGGGYTLDKTAGTGDATIRIIAADANTDTAPKSLGAVTIAATGVEEPKTVSVSQKGADAPGPTPEDVIVTVDFAEGPAVATPALPASSEEALTGRHEYTIAGYTFAIYADAADKGKFFWTDNSQYYPMEEPYKGLFFSKTGAYVEFPAFADKALAQVVYVFNNGAGELPDLDFTTEDDAFVEYGLEYADDGSGITYTLLSPAAGTAYRLTVMDRKNAQVSKFVLTYKK